jgi:hypothetical protein
MPIKEIKNKIRSSQPRFIFSSLFLPPKKASGRSEFAAALGFFLFFQNVCFVIPNS